MKILTLIIKQSYFDLILSGEKTQEFRDLRPKSIKRYCQVDEGGLEIVKDGIILTREYDAIRFYVSYNKNRATALVEVKGSEVELFVDENDEFIECEENGEKYLMAQIAYDLGEILEQ